MATKKAASAPVQEKVVRPPAKEVLQKFLAKEGIEVITKPLSNIKTISDGSYIVSPPQILVSYNDEPRKL